MTDAPKPNEHNDGLSRRDFVQGRFMKAFGVDGKKKPTSTSNQPARRQLVMRYPKTLGHVAAGDSATDVAESKKQSIETSTDAVVARRRTIPLFRPPGAIDEASFLAGCTKCGECAKACPHDAIVHAPERLREAVGTPVIEADHQACQMCEDFPCISACEPGVLTTLVPPVIGTAKITEHLCLAHHGTTCTVCSERCPVDNAISVVDGKPTVNESKCTGCGVCRYVCPAPENAILLMPTFHRPMLRNNE